MEKWIEELFEKQDAQQRAQARLSWPEKVRISRVMYEGFLPFRKMREEWQKKNAAAREDPPKQEPR